MDNLSKGAAQAGVAIDIARQIESRLGALGATGKGLHEKAASIEDKLPEALVKKLRSIAAVRNKLAHEDDLMPDEELAAFAQAGKEAIAELEELAAKGKPRSSRPKAKPRKKATPAPQPASEDGILAGTVRTMRLGGLVFLVGFAAAVLLMLLGNDGPGLWAGVFASNFLFGWYLLRRSRRSSGSP